MVTARGGRRLSEEEGWALFCASVQVYSRCMVSVTVSLEEVVTAFGGRRLSEDEGWALLCASVLVYSRHYGVSYCELDTGDCPWWKASLRG